VELSEVAPPGFGHTKGDKKKGVEKGGTAAAFDRARKEGRFKGSKSDMFAIMWSQKNKGDKPHYKPGTDEKYKKYQKEELTGDMKTDLEKYRVPRGPGGNPIRMGDKVRSMKGDQPLGKLKVKYGADKVREYYKKNKAVDEGYKGTADLSKADPAAKKKVEDRIAKHFGTKRVPGGKMGVKPEPGHRGMKPIDNSKKVAAMRKEEAGGMDEGVVDMIKKGAKRHSKAVEKKKIKNRKAVPYAALGASYEPEGEMVQELFGLGNKKYPYGKATKKNPRGKRDQAELDRAQAYIKKNPNFGKKAVKEGVGRAAIGAVLGSPFGALGSAAGAAIGASMGKKKKVTTGGVKKKPTNYFKAGPKVTSSESLNNKGKKIINPKKNPVIESLDSIESRAKDRQKFNTFYKKAKEAKAKEQGDSTRSDSRRHGIKFSDAKGSGRIRGGKKVYN